MQDRLERGGGGPRGGGGRRQAVACVVTNGHGDAGRRQPPRDGGPDPGSAFDSAAKSRL
jgi:hypothetical protein